MHRELKSECCQSFANASEVYHMAGCNMAANRIIVNITPSVLTTLRATYMYTYQKCQTRMYDALRVSI